jgi:small-conductance mechanosensitive channel
MLSVAWLTLAISLICVLVGYVALGSFIVKQMVWIVTVLSSTYLLTMLIHDGGVSLQTAVKRNADDENLTHSRTRTRSQALVLLSGLGRLLVVLFALTLLLAPFGEGPTELIGHIDYVHAGVSIGEVQIRPASVLQSVLVLLLGFGCVRVLQSWLIAQYLPTTALDPGMRLSAGTLFGYAGYVVAIALALSAVGIGLERVAWIASALSVGIGFGLQAVVQNFVSGLILLAERPVRVGDWVSLGGVEGDIRRINVRATEIQMNDRSTVIVPNSEFITKVVRNVTHANPFGLVQIKLPMPLSTDPEQVRGLILAVFQDHPDVLDEPVAKVFLDGIDTNSLVFNATGYVNSPRAAYTVRSALLFDMLKRLREAGLSLSKPPTLLMAPPPPNLPDLPETSAAATDRPLSTKASNSSPAK